MTMIFCFKATGQCQNSLLLSAGGDVLIHKSLFVEATQSKSGFDSFFSQIEPYFKMVDFSYLNLEGPIAPGINRRTKLVPDVGFVYDGDIYSGENLLFNYPIQLAVSLKKIGIDLVSTANNHALDRGLIGLEKTIESLNQVGLEYIGTSTTEKFYRTTTVNGLKLAWIACTEMLNQFKDRKGKILLCGPHLANQISVLKQTEKPDFLIIVPHWGNEYMEQPSSNQVKWAKNWVEAGADLILGSHPHVIQKIDWLPASDGRKSLVAYSLGNFISGQKEFERKSGVVLFFEINKIADVTSISKIKYLPISTERSPIRVKVYDTSDRENSILESYLKTKFLPFAQRLSNIDELAQIQNAQSCETLPKAKPNL